MNRKEFAKVALDKELKTFVVHVAALKALLGSAEMMIHPMQAALITTLKPEKALTKIQPKYAAYADVFSFDLTIELLQNNSINKYAIKLKNGK